VNKNYYINHTWLCRSCPWALQ